MIRSTSVKQMVVPKRELKLQKYPDYFDRPDEAKEQMIYLQKLLKQTKNTQSQKQLNTSPDNLITISSHNSYESNNKSMTSNKTNNYSEKETGALKMLQIRNRRKKNRQISILDGEYNDNNIVSLPNKNKIGLIYAYNPSKFYTIKQRQAKKNLSNEIN